jgi:hypothetical protein
VHPELGPFGPPPVDPHEDHNPQLLTPATHRHPARQRRQRRTPNPGGELPTLLVRGRNQTEPPKYAQSAPRTLHLSQKVPIGTGLGGGLACGAIAVAASAPPLLAGLALVPAGLGWAAVRLRSAKKRLPLILPLDAAARSVIDAYKELGEMSDKAAGSLKLEPRTSGYLRCELSQATPEEGKRFATALDELVSLSDNPRYLVSRPLADPRRGALGLLGRVLTRQAPFDERMHPVPADLARKKERAEAFARSWRRHVGPGRLVFTQRTEEGREARAGAASSDGGYETLVRDVWV